MDKIILIQKEQHFCSGVVIYIMAFSIGYSNLL